MQIEYIDDVQKVSKHNRPAIIEWNKEKILYRHSFMSTIREMAQWSNEIDLMRVGLIGDPGSGKSTMAMAIAHGIHKVMLKEYHTRYNVNKFGEAELKNLDVTLEALPRTNHIIIFDDVSFLTGTLKRKEIERIKQISTKIRHLPGGADVKIILIYNYHYTKGFDKFLRMADYTYILSAGTQERANIQELTKSKNMVQVDRFAKMRAEAVVTGAWSVTYAGGGKKHTYKYRKPFIPALFINTKGARLIVSPTRHWMDRICNRCAAADNENNCDIDLGEFIQSGKAKFGDRQFMSALKYTCTSMAL